MNKTYSKRHSKVWVNNLTSNILMNYHFDAKNVEKIFCKYLLYPFEISLRFFGGSDMTDVYQQTSVSVTRAPPIVRV